MYSYCTSQRRKCPYIFKYGISCTYSKGIVITWSRNLIKREQEEEIGRRLGRRDQDERRWKTRKDRAGRRELVGHRRAGISAAGKTEDRGGVTGEVNDRQRQEGQEQE
jgi:hypothetical protein